MINEQLISQIKGHNGNFPVKVRVRKCLFLVRREHDPIP